MTTGIPKSLNNVTSTFFNTVHLLPKDLNSNMVTPTCFLPQALSNLVTPLCGRCHAPAIRCEYPYHTGEVCFAC